MEELYFILRNPEYPMIAFLFKRRVEAIEFKRDKGEPSWVIDRGYFKTIENNIDRLIPQEDK